MTKLLYEISEMSVSFTQKNLHVLLGSKCLTGSDLTSLSVAGFLTWDKSQFRFILAQMKYSIIKNRKTQVPPEHSSWYKNNE